MTEEKNAKIFYGYTIVIAGFFIIAVSFGTSQAYGVFLKPMLADFGWTREIVSWAFSLNVLIGGFLSVPVGRLSDRFGPRGVLTVCGFFLGGGYWLMSGVGSVWELYLYYGLIMGIGMSGLWVALLSVVARWFSKRRSTMTAVLLAGMGAGTMVIPHLARWLISRYGWGDAYSILGIMVLVVMVAGAQFLRRDPAQKGLMPYGEGGESRGQNRGMRVFSLREAMRTPQLWLIVAIYILYGFCMISVAVHVYPHVTDLGISDIMAANIVAIFGGIGIAGRIIVGVVGDRVGNRLTLRIVLLLMAVALLCLWLGDRLWILYLFAVIYGLSYAGADVVLPPILAELFGLKSLGVIIGITTLAFTIGGAIGPAIAGRIFDMSGSYWLAFLICTVLVLLAVVLAILVRPISRGGAGEPVSSPNKDG
ncbi:MFS transporter [Chloroflexota bacterium]